VIGRDPAFLNEIISMVSWAPLKKFAIFYYYLEDKLINTFMVKANLSAISEEKTE